MRKRTLLSLLCLLMVSMTSFAQLYKATTRATSLENGKKYLIYNTCLPSGQDRTGFLYNNGSKLSLAKLKPSTATRVPSSYLWELTVVDAATNLYNLKSVSSNTYVGIGGVTTNTATRPIYLTEWTTAPADRKAGVNSEGADGTTVENKNISTSDYVYLVWDNASTTWNGDQNAWTTWGTGHPYAFYNYEEVEGSKELTDAYASLEVEVGKMGLTPANLLAEYGAQASVYSSNASDKSEGQNFANLIDNDWTSIWHSDWHNEATGTHYLQANLEESVSSFRFYYKRRSHSNSDRPNNITISGCATVDGEFTEITTLTSVLPTDNGNNEYLSEVINCGSEYKHIRFTVNGTNTNGTKDNGFVYFSFGEFYFFPGNAEMENKLALADIADLNPTNPEVTLEQINERLDALKKINEQVSDVTYHFMVGGVEVANQTGRYSASRPDLIPSNPWVSIGDITVSEKDVYLSCTYNLPFTPSASFATAKWYILDMHSNDAGTSDVNNGTNQYIWTYNEENADITLPKLSGAEIAAGYMPNDNCLWAFVGNPFTGFKIYNKVAGESLTLRKETNNNTPVVMSATDDRNVFYLHTTTSGIANSFAIKLADDDYYVNTQANNGVKVLRGWNQPDGGSSIRVFEKKTDVKPSSFVTLKGEASGTYASGATGGARIQLVSDLTVSEIFYYDANKNLLNYGSGLYAYDTRHMSNVGGTKHAYNIVKLDGGNYYVECPSSSGGKCLYNAVDATQTDRGNVYGTNANYRWEVTQLTSIPVTVTDAGYATLCVPVALTIPSGVEAYTGAIEGEKLMLTAVDGTIPANTAVIIKAAAGTHDFAITTDVAAIADNALAGTLYTMAKPENAYTLQMQNGAVGMYPFSGANVQGFKAYMTVAASEVKGFLFDIDGELTGIESIEAEGEGVKVIYDLNGRRVERAIKGVYIIDGKKVMVK